MSDDNQRQERSVPETPEELVSLATEYFSHEFANSARDCPSPGQIVELIESGQLPDEGLRQHFLACSTCFVTYRERLQRSRERRPVAGGLWQRISELLHAPWLRVLMASLPVLLIVVLAVFYFRSKNAQEQVSVVNPPVEVVNANSNVATPAPLSSPVQTDSSTKGKTTTYVARIDLRSYSPQRSSEMSEEPAPVKIESKPTAFTIALPEDSPAGPYSISILDAFGKVIKARNSHSADGKRLTATLNLDNLRAEKYRLCVSRSNEPPNCYPIVITNRGQ